MNEDDNSKNSILVAIAKKEFTTLLILNLYPSIYQGLRSIWDDAKRTSPPKQVYDNFQERLTKVRKWNHDIISSEYSRIVKNLKGDWNLEDLIKKIFVVNTQILASTNGSQTKQIKVKVPKGENFLHCCYKETARAFYEHPLLFEDRPITISRIEMSKNLQKAYKIIMNCIEMAILNLLPMNSLLKESYDSDVEGELATPTFDMYKNNPLYTIQNDQIQIVKGNHQQLPISPIIEPSMIPTSDIQSQISQISQSSKEFESTTPATTIPAKKIYFDDRQTQNIDVKSNDDVAQLSVPDSGVSIPNVPKSEVQINLDVLSLNDNEPQLSEAPSLPELDNFDSKSFFSDASET